MPILHAYRIMAIASMSFQSYQWPNCHRHLSILLWPPRPTGRKKSIQKSPQQSPTLTRRKSLRQAGAQKPPIQPIDDLDIVMFISRVQYVGEEDHSIKVEVLVHPCPQDCCCDGCDTHRSLDSDLAPQKCQWIITPTMEMHLREWTIRAFMALSHLSQSRPRP